MSDQSSTAPPTAVPVDEQIAQANDSGRVPVVFIHGLWLLPASWDRWAQLFEQAGYAPVSPGWPDDPDTVAADWPRPAMICASRPPKEWPITAGSRVRVPMTCE